MESTCDIGDIASRLAYISEVTRGGSGDVKDRLLVVISLVKCRGDDANGYSIPNSEKYQSRMSLDEMPPTEMTGLRSTAAENKSGNRLITKKKKKNHYSKDQKLVLEKTYDVQRGTLHDFHPI